MPKTRYRLSENFTIEEFDCNDGTKVPARYYAELEALCRDFLEPMRAKFGPCNVHSGFRTSAYNQRIGGARFSFHVYTDRVPTAGVAADVSFAKGSVLEWTEKARRLRSRKRGGKGGIGYYPQGGFTHIDTRDYAADWNGS